MIRMPELMCLRIAWTFDEATFGGGQAPRESEHRAPPDDQSGTPVVALDGANVVEAAQLMARGQ